MIDFPPPPAIGPWLRMRTIPLVLLVLAMLCLPLAADDDALYRQLASAEFMKDTFTSKRTPTGIDFNSQERIELNGKPHSKFHLELEGALPVPGVASLEQAIVKIAELVKPEVDADHIEVHSMYPGLGVDVVNVNGVKVAFFQYKNSREPDTFNRRALLYAKGNIYIVTMSLHSVPEKDRMGMIMILLVTTMIDSKQIPNLTPVDL